MIDRRFTLQALLSLAAAPLGAEEGADPAPAVSPAELLVDELSRIEARAYSEEGIPMFLAGEDLAGGNDGVPDGFVPAALNGQLAEAYRDYAALLPGLERPMSEYDAANLVELLALRDFEGPR